MKKSCVFIFIIMVLFVSKDIVYANAGAAFFEELPSGFHVVPMKNVRQI